MIFKEVTMQFLKARNVYFLLRYLLSCTQG